MSGNLFNTGSPRVIAHRGASGSQVENSLAAFRAAVELGADGVELDVHTSADGELYVHHDYQIPGLGAVSEITSEAIGVARLRNGEPVPTLRQALQVLPNMEVWIELKGLAASADHTLMSQIQSAPDTRCSVHSFDHRIIARLGSAFPGLRTGVLSASYPVDPVAAMLQAGATTLWQVWHLIDESLVTAAHRAQAEIIAWTVNDATVANRLSALGVDGLCGNFPERLRSGYN